MHPYATLCPTCRAPAGSSCIHQSGELRENPHVGRLNPRLLGAREIRNNFMFGKKAQQRKQKKQASAQYDVHVREKIKALANKHQATMVRSYPKIGVGAEFASRVLAISFYQAALKVPGAVGVQAPVRTRGVWAAALGVAPRENRLTRAQRDALPSPIQDLHQANIALDFIIRRFGKEANWLKVVKAVERQYPQLQSKVNAILARAALEEARPGQKVTMKEAKAYAKEMLG